MAPTWAGPGLFKGTIQKLFPTGLTRNLPKQEVNFHWNSFSFFNFFNFFYCGYVRTNCFCGEGFES